MGNEQRMIQFAGNVQGVGFRFTACRTAGRYDVTGTVRNCSDGSVECVVEGEQREIDAFLGELAEAMSGYIDGQISQTADYSGKYSSFSVAF